MLRSASLIGLVAGAAVNIQVTVKEMKLLTAETGTSTQFLAEGNAAAKGLPGKGFRQIAAEFINVAYQDGKTAGEIPSATTLIGITACAFPSSDMGVKLTPDAGGVFTMLNVYDCVLAYDAKDATKFGTGVDPATNNDADAWLTAVKSVNAAVGNTNENVLANGVCGGTQLTNCAAPTSAKAVEIGTIEGTLKVKWTMNAVVKQTTPATPEGDPSAALLVDRIIYEAYKTANGGTAIAGTSSGLGGSSGPFWKTAALGGQWAVTGSHVGVTQGAHFTITADSTAARQLEETDESGALRELAAALKTHTIAWKDEHALGSSIKLMKTAYEKTTAPLLSTGVGAAVTTSLAALCAGGGCTHGVGADGEGWNAVKPTYTDKDTAELAVTKVNGAAVTWTKGVAAAAAAGVKVAASMAMTMTILDSAKAAEMQTDTKFVALMKASVLAALTAGDATVTTLPDFKLTAVSWTARRTEEDEVDAKARQLATAARKITIAWEATAADATAAGKITTEVKKTTFGATFEAKFAEEAVKADAAPTITGAPTITAGSATASIVATASVASSAVGALATGLVFSLLSLSLM
jgi:hypothetical protein